MTGDEDLTGLTVAELTARIHQQRADSRARRTETIGELQQIVSALDGIADTMKRLAINATIEPAYAGNTASAAQDAVRRAQALLEARDKDGKVD